MNRGNTVWPEIGFGIEDVRTSGIYKLASEMEWKTFRIFGRDEWNKVSTIRSESLVNGTEVYVPILRLANCFVRLHTFLKRGVPLRSVLQDPQLPNPILFNVLILIKRTYISTRPRDSSYPPTTAPKTLHSDL